MFERIGQSGANILDVVDELSAGAKKLAMSVNAGAGFVYEYANEAELSAKIDCMERVATKQHKLDELLSKQGAE